jgi:type II secretory pathway component PulJ
LTATEYISMVGVGLALVALILTILLKWLDVRREDRKEREKVEKEIEMGDTLGILGQRISALEQPQLDGSKRGPATAGDEQGSEPGERRRSRSLPIQRLDRPSASRRTDGHVPSPPTPPPAAVTR